MLDCEKFNRAPGLLTSVLSSSTFLAKINNHLSAMVLCLSSVLQQLARLAQSVERETLNLKAAGSSPALGYLFAFCIDSIWSLRCYLVAFKNFFLVRPGRMDARRMRWRIGRFSW
ncbi:uncharacterized protein BDV14DRAFT_73834 [Aspergillus stella-maris]|uniref:uncharacterized protein n=1 Tax=Aspergillus stella-maris TaxID=1810926 RepID=UPI003CCCD730